MKRLLEFWAGSSDTVKIALAVAVAAVVLGLVWLGVAAGDVAAWLGSN